jgi:hypothetical protein
MKRLLVAVALAACTALAAGPAAWGQTSDSIRYYDRATKKEVTAKCVLESETPARVTLREGVRQKKVPAAEVLDVTYDKSVGPGSLVTYRRATNHEHDADNPKLDAAARRRELDTALAAYRELLGEVQNPAALRHVAFSMARLLVRESEDDPAQVGPAIAALERFVKEHGDGWQLTQAVRLLGQLQAGKGDFAAAQKTYEALAARDDVAPETRQECELLGAGLLLRMEKPAEAEGRLRKLAAALAPTDPAAGKVQVYLAQCDVAAGKLEAAEAKLKALLVGGLDSSARGLVYNALGDVARRRDRPEDAFWDYLWVDVVYNQDKHEQAKALYYLTKLFVQVKNDPARAEQCRQRLLDKEFLGMEYQKLAAKEKP